MSPSLQQFYDLLPAVYRVRDADQNYRLRALLGAISEQIDVLDEDLAQLYDDLFIETCGPWVVPYIGDLVGVRGIIDIPGGQISSRAYVAGTIAYRRRKGTLKVLADLARDVTRYPASVTEGFQRLVVSQWLNHIRPEPQAFPDLRRMDRMARVATAFDRLAHTVDVRRSEPARGRYNIQDIAIYLWRLSAYSFHGSAPARASTNAGERRFRFSPLGIDAPLFQRPNTASEGEAALPLALGDVLPSWLRPGVSPASPSPGPLRYADEHAAQLYGASFEIEVDHITVPFASISICNLQDVDAAGTQWAHAPKDKFAIDPRLGRFVVPPGQETKRISVTFHCGFSANMGSGEYERASKFNSKFTPVFVPSDGNLQTALNSLSGVGVVEVTSSNRFDGDLSISPAANKTLEFRAANGSRPLLMLSKELTINGADGAEVVIDGFLIAGGVVSVKGPLRRLFLRHCTLVPTAGQTALRIDSPNTEVDIENCISGRSEALDAGKIVFTNSILDAGSMGANVFSDLGGHAERTALRVEKSTVIGQVVVGTLEYASNSIFFGLVQAERKQTGCVRFCYIPAGSAIPPRYRCVPESEAETGTAAPMFTARKYGHPAYCQLHRLCSERIRMGADDGSEMGAFHDLYHPQREANLRTALVEYLRFGLEAGSFYAT